MHETWSAVDTGERTLRSNCSRASSAKPLPDEGISCMDWMMPAVREIMTVRRTDMSICGST